MSDVRIEARVIIRDILSERAARAVLPNGKMIIAFARKRDPLPELRIGDEWTAHLSLCDFSRGHLVQPAAAAPPFKGATSAS